MCRRHDEAAWENSPASRPRGRDADAGGLRAALGRRRFLISLVGATGSLLVACAEGGPPITLVSDEKIAEMGAASWQQILQDTQPSDNASYRRTAQQVASDLLRTAGEEPAAWEIAVFEGEDANAFALPGRKIGIFEGMFDIAGNEAQLAAVIGHEIGHLQAEHPGERINSEMAAQLGLQLVGVALNLGDVAMAREIAGLLGAGVQYGLILPYSRNQELEADRLGLMTMARAGYDPEAAVALWQNMQATGRNPPGFLSTHPHPGQRIEELEAMMPEALRAYRGA